MKNYKKIRRIFEQAAVVPPALGANPQMEAPAYPDMQDTQMPPAEMPQMGMSQEALPAPGETSAPMDPMTMTVGDFISKCREIDPLVCMGLESFIEKNQHSFATPAPAMQYPAPAMDQDVKFSNVIDTQAPAEPAQNFSLDQSPETLNFPG